jgi:hypothetical protein
MTIEPKKAKLAEAKAMKTATVGYLGRYWGENELHEPWEHYVLLDTDFRELERYSTHDEAFDAAQYRWRTHEGEPQPIIRTEAVDSAWTRYKRVAAFHTEVRDG